jgi:cytochrome bd-type quinol oxidase subunit 2
MFASSALAMGGLWTVVGGSVFPSVANPLGQGDPAITIYNSSAPLGTMRLVVTFSLVGMAAIIAYVMYVYGVLGGRRETETE